MPEIRLLTAVQGDGPVVGRVGDVLEVDDRTARVWADGERAERVNPGPTVPRRKP
jgi:hypothetical protein